MFREHCPGCGARFGRRNPEHVYPPDLAQRPWYRLVLPTLTCTRCKAVVRLRYARWSWMAYALWMVAFILVRHPGLDGLTGYFTPEMASDIRDFSPILFIGFSAHVLSRVGRRWELAAPAEANRSPAADTPPPAR